MAEYLTLFTPLGLYSYQNQGSFYTMKDWQGNYLNFNGIPAVGSLTGSGERIALSQRLGNSTHNPAYIVDPDNMSSPVGCVHNPGRESEKVLCCMMADWVVGVGLDRIIAPAENQCFVWDADGDRDWFTEYLEADDDRPPFGALGDLVDDGYDDLIVATREGTVIGYDYEGLELSDLDFPYTLPSEVYGGFVIADLDNDGKVEVVFGTMDNYLHIWELGSCDEDYSPWPQCQHDAMRTGVLE